jgi:DNA-binding GntR family transcriptional regulator
MERLWGNGDGRPLVRNAAAAAADVVRQAILDGRVQPGEPLREEHLATQLGLSRTPIREALLILQTEGLVEAAPKRGAVVRTYDPVQIADLYETRALLEGHAAALAARHISGEELERLRDSCRRYGELLNGDGETPALVQENRVFHDVVIAAGRSAATTRLIDTVTRVPLIYRSFAWYSPQEKEIGLHYHERIVHALERGDGMRAGALMQEHIREALDVLSSHVPDALASR